MFCILNKKKIYPAYISKLPSFFRSRKKKKLQSHKRVCENEDFCDLFMPSEDKKIFEFSQHQRSDEVPFIICADLECITEKIDRCTKILKIHLNQK